MRMNDKREEPHLIFVRTSHILFINIGVQVAILAVGVLYFLFLTARFRLQYWLSRERQRAVPDDQIIHSVINANPICPASMDGYCCGCGGAADLILLPCYHAACCSKCGQHATLCPHCNAAVTGVQKLHMVA